MVPSALAPARMAERRTGGSRRAARSPGPWQGESQAGHQGGSCLDLPICAMGIATRMGQECLHTRDAWGGWDSVPVCTD